MQRLIITDDENTLNGEFVLLDDDPPDPDQEGVDYTGGWKLCGNLKLVGDRNYHGTMQFARDQIYLVKSRGRNGTSDDYIEIEKDEHRQLRNMSADSLYLVWWQNLVPPEEFVAGKTKLAQGKNKHKKVKKSK